MKNVIPLFFILSLLAAGISGCATAPATPEAKSDLDEQAADTIAAFKSKGAELSYFFDKSYGFAVFPDVTTGAAGIGGAYGRGEVFDHDEVIGYCNITQGTIGVQLGGQSYSEIIFFENKTAMNLFKEGQTSFEAAASAVAADAGASKTANYRKGFAVYTLAQGGLMFQAAVGGQHFEFVPK